MELIWALGGENTLAEKERLLEGAEQLLDYYVELMEGSPLTDIGEAVARAIVIANDYEITDGEVIHNHISLLVGNPSDCR